MNAIKDILLSLKNDSYNWYRHPLCNNLIINKITGIEIFDLSINIYFLNTVFIYMNNKDIKGFEPNFLYRILILKSVNKIK